MLELADAPGEPPRNPRGTPTSNPSILSRKTKGKGKGKAIKDGEGGEQEPKGKAATAAEKKKAPKLVEKLNAAEEKAQAWALAATRLGLPATVAAKTEVWLANLAGEKAKLELMLSDGWTGFAKTILGEVKDTLDEFNEFAPTIEGLINATEAMNA